MWCSSVKRVRSVFFQRCWKTSRDFPDMPQTDNIYLAATTAALISVNSRLLRTSCFGFSILKMPSYFVWAVQNTFCSSRSFFFFFFWPQQLSQPDIFQRKGQFISKSSFRELIAPHQLLLYFLFFNNKNIKVCLCLGRMLVYLHVIMVFLDCYL